MLHFPLPPPHRIEDHLDTFPSSIPGEPFCSLSPLPFSMYALEHLEGVQNRRSLVAPPEKSVLSAIGMRMEVFGSLVHHALSKVSCVHAWHGMHGVTCSY